MKLKEKTEKLQVKLDPPSENVSAQSSRKSSKQVSPQKNPGAPPVSPTPTHLSATSSKVTYEAKSKNDNEGIYLSNLFYNFQ